MDTPMVLPRGNSLSCQQLNVGIETSEVYIDTFKRFERYY